MSKLKLSEIIVCPGLTVLIFEYILKHHLLTEQLNNLVRKAIIYCIRGFKILDNTSLAWAQRYLTALVAKYFPERRGNKLLVLGLLHS